VAQEVAEQVAQEELEEEARNLSPLLWAKTLIFFSTRADEHFGQRTFSSFKTSSSNSSPHFLQIYSNNGIF